MSTLVAKRCLNCHKVRALPGHDYCSGACRDGLAGWELAQCESCGRPIRRVRKDDVRFCSNACRQRAYRQRRGWNEDQLAKIAALSR